MKGYRKLAVGEIMLKGDIGIVPEHRLGTKCMPSFEIYRPITKNTKQKYSYIARVGRLSSGRFFVDIIGINGKFAFGSKNYSKRSYAVRQAKSFCSKVKGVKLQIGV
jgi:hypothetical protein